MKKYFRILLNLALVFLLIFSSNAVYAVNTNNGTDLQLIRKDIEQQVRSQYMNDPQFIMDVQENGPSHGEEMLNRIIDSKLRKLLDSSSGIGIQSGNGSVFYVPNLKNIKQSYTWSCGAASILQALYGFGVEDDVAGLTDREKEDTIIEDAEANGKGLIVYRVRNVLNKYTGAGYIYELGRDMTLSEFGDNLAVSLMWDLAPVLHARTGSLEYYKGKDIGHYLTVSFISWPRFGSIEDAIVTINDPHYKDDYFGNHDVSLEEAYGTVNLTDQDRYVLYVPY